MGTQLGRSHPKGDHGRQQAAAGKASPEGKEREAGDGGGPGVGGGGAKAERLEGCLEEVEQTKCAGD